MENSGGQVANFTGWHFEHSWFPFLFAPWQFSYKIFFMALWHAVQQVSVSYHAGTSGVAFVVDFSFRRLARFTPGMCDVATAF